MSDMQALEIGKSPNGMVKVPLRFINRHGLITGATGSGKTVSLQLLVEQLSHAGVPVFLPDVKGDLIGIANPGQMSEKIAMTLAQKGLSAPVWRGCSVRLWSIGGDSTHASSKVCARVDTVGALLLARLLDLNDVQSSVLQVAFRIAREQKMPMNTLPDLRGLLGWIANNRDALVTNYGAFADSTLSAIQRGLVVLEEQQATSFFSNSELILDDLMQCDSGSGVVNILDARSLLLQPSLYAVAFGWLLSRLYEELPEVGDLPKPKLVLFIDEAHLLFDTLGKTVQENLERSVRLIRSRGVGIYFVSQLPTDIPEKILGQLGNRFQHVLRSFTPKDQKAIKIAAQTMRPNPSLDIDSVITQLAPGEALVSVLDDNGTPMPTQRIWVNMPGSQIGASVANSLLPPIAQRFTLPSNNVVSLLAVTSQALAKEHSDVSWRSTMIRGITMTLAWLLRC